MALTQSEENYIKAIYALELDNSGPIATNDLAAKMETKASSVTDMIKRLSEKEFILYEKYKGCELTEKGKEIAIKTIRKHRLWETFLVEKLNFSWDEVHDIAEQLEHIQSKELTNRLEAFLNFPKFDPHGDPIPDEHGNFSTRIEAHPLCEVPIGTPASVIGVDDDATEFLQFLDKLEIQLGTKLLILERYNFDQSIKIAYNNKEVQLSKTASSRIKVQLLLQ